MSGFFLGLCMLLFFGTIALLAYIYENYPD